MTQELIQTRSEVYFIHDSMAKAIKIGHSKDVNKRLDSLQTGTPGELTLLGTVVGGRETEKSYHRLFAAHHIRREWFNAPAPVLDEVRRIILNDGSPRTVEAELFRRGECRYGLRGVEVALVEAPERKLIVEGSEWDRYGKLRLSLCPAGTRVVRMFEGRAVPKPAPGDWAACLVSADELFRSTFVYPFGYIKRADPAKCILLSAWPIPCPCWLTEWMRGERDLTEAR